MIRQSLKVLQSDESTTYQLQQCKGLAKETTVSPGENEVQKRLKQKLPQIIRDACTREELMSQQ